MKYLTYCHPEFLLESAFVLSIAIEYAFQHVSCNNKTSFELNEIELNKTSQSGIPCDSCYCHTICYHEFLVAFSERLYSM